MLGKGILVFFLCLYVDATCHSIPIGCNGTTDSIALSLAQSLQGIDKALQVCHENCYSQTSTIPRITTSHKGLTLWEILHFIKAVPDHSH